MGKPLVRFVGITLALLAAACGGSASGGGGATGTVTIGDRAFHVNSVTLTYESGDDGFFRIEGDDAAHPNEDCLPGLGGGIALYGDMPPSASSIADLAGRELPFEFSGDGDDFNLCFVGSDGLLGVETGTVRIDSVEGSTVRFSFSGTFVLYDGNGGESPGVSASGQGTARVATK